MPEESKKNQQKGKNEPKDQRRRRQGRQPAGPVEKKAEKVPERPVEKQIKEPEKLAYEPPPPEFYKNLKRETDEILKITEEANTKYKKKEIQSNWAKYEMPVETYEEIDEQENLGADYEKLIQAPANAGGHFQFKHEKCWDTETGPSQYDKYFDINMEFLFLALSTIPFYERNNIEHSVFNESDIETMKHRANKFKYKYFNDKKYMTPELEAQEEILKSLGCNNEEPGTVKEDGYSEDESNNNEYMPMETYKKLYSAENVMIEDKPVSTLVNDNKREETELDEEINFKIQDDYSNTMSHIAIDDIELDTDDVTKKVEANKSPDIVFMKIEPPKECKASVEVTANKQETTAKDTPTKPKFESPDELEKWLDDFLDG